MHLGVGDVRGFWRRVSGLGRLPGAPKNASG